MKKLLRNCIIVLCAFLIGGAIKKYEEKHGILTVTIPEIEEPDVPAVNVSRENRININTAGKEELQALSGIGEALAERIISYREKNGSFYQPEDLMKVSGVGKSKFDKIKDFIYAE